MPTATARTSPPVAPFAGRPGVLLRLPAPTSAADPSDADVLAELPARLAEEADALARELGAPVHFASDDAPAGHGTWTLALTPTRTANHVLDRDAGALRTEAPDVAALLGAFGSLRALSRHAGGPVPIGHAATLEEAVTRVATEVTDTWVGFHVPRLGVSRARWRALCRQHAHGVLGAADPVQALQRWLTPLGDAHTWVVPARPWLVAPYGAVVRRGALVLTHVKPWTAGWAAGARPGDRLLGVDVASAWARTPAAAHAAPLAVARRLLSAPAGTTLSFESRGPRARTARWEETLTPPEGPPAAWELLPSGVGWLWIGAWVPDAGVEALVDEALQSLRGHTDRLVVDLRGNGGGRVKMAEAFRDRFLRSEAQVGALHATRPGGGLGPPVPLRAAPSEDPAARWHGKVRFLTSPLTYSASETALLGLQGLPHVQVWGERTGGGAGRTRRLPLLPGWRLTVSMATVTDRAGRVIEGRGLAPDHPCAPDRDNPDGGDPVLDAAVHTPW
jgi:carboxyl-terminal processing protease